MPKCSCYVSLSVLLTLFTIFLVAIYGGTFLGFYTAEMTRFIVERTTETNSIALRTGSTIVESSLNGIVAATTKAKWNMMSLFQRYPSLVATSTNSPSHRYNMSITTLRLSELIVFQSAIFQLLHQQIAHMPVSVGLVDLFSRNRWRAAMAPLVRKSNGEFVIGGGMGVRPLSTLVTEEHFVLELWVPYLRTQQRIDMFMLRNCKYLSNGEYILKEYYVDTEELEAQFNNPTRYPGPKPQVHWHQTPEQFEAYCKAFIPRVIRRNINTMETVDVTREYAAKVPQYQLNSNRVTAQVVDAIFPTAPTTREEMQAYLNSNMFKGLVDLDTGDDVSGSAVLDTLNAHERWTKEFLTPHGGTVPFKAYALPILDASYDPMVDGIPTSPYVQAWISAHVNGESFKHVLSSANAKPTPNSNMYIINSVGGFVTETQASEQMFPITIPIAWPTYVDTRSPPTIHTCLNYSGINLASAVRTHPFVFPYASDRVELLCHRSVFDLPANDPIRVVWEERVKPVLFQSPLLNNWEDFEPISMAVSKRDAIWGDATSDFVSVKRLLTVSGEPVRSPCIPLDVGYIFGVPPDPILVNGEWVMPTRQVSLSLLYRSCPFENLGRTLPYFLVSVVPSDDVLKDFLGDMINTIIIVACCVFACLVGIGLVFWIIFRKLSAVSDQMIEVAQSKDSSYVEKLSKVTEIRNVQATFISLVERLRVTDTADEDLAMMRVLERRVLLALQTEEQRGDDVDDGEGKGEGHIDAGFGQQHDSRGGGLYMNAAQGEARTVESSSEVKQAPVGLESPAWASRMTQQGLLAYWNTLSPHTAEGEAIALRRRLAMKNFRNACLLGVADSASINALLARRQALNPSGANTAQNEIVAAGMARVGAAATKLPSTSAILFAAASLSSAVEMGFIKTSVACLRITLQYFRLDPSMEAQKALIQEVIRALSSTASDGGPRDPLSFMRANNNNNSTNAKNNNTHSNKASMPATKGPILCPEGFLYSADHNSVAIVFFPLQVLRHIFPRHYGNFPPELLPTARDNKRGVSSFPPPPPPSSRCDGPADACTRALLFALRLQSSPALRHVGSSPIPDYASCYFTLDTDPNAVMDISNATLTSTALWKEADRLQRRIAALDGIIASSHASPTDAVGPYDNGERGGVTNRSRGAPNAAGPHTMISAQQRVAAASAERIAAQKSLASLLSPPARAPNFAGLLILSNAIETTRRLASLQLQRLRSYMLISDRTAQHINPAYMVTSAPVDCLEMYCAAFGSPLSTAQRGDGGDGGALTRAPSGGGGGGGGGLARPSPASGGVGGMDGMPLLNGAAPLPSADGALLENAAPVCGFVDGDVPKLMASVNPQLLLTLKGVAATAPTNTPHHHALGGHHPSAAVQQHAEYYYDNHHARGGGGGGGSVLLGSALGGGGGGGSAYNHANMPTALASSQYNGGGGGSLHGTHYSASVAAIRERRMGGGYANMAGGVMSGGGGNASVSEHASSYYFRQQPARGDSGLHHGDYYAPSSAQGGAAPNLALTSQNIDNLIVAARSRGDDGWDADSVSSSSDDDSEKEDEGAPPTRHKRLVLSSPTGTHTGGGSSAHGGSSHTASSGSGGNSKKSALNGVNSGKGGSNTFNNGDVNGTSHPLGDDGDGDHAHHHHPHRHHTTGTGGSDGVSMLLARRTFPSGQLVDPLPCRALDAIAIDPLTSPAELGRMAASQCALPRRCGSYVTVRMLVYEVGILSPHVPETIRMHFQQGFRMLLAGNYGAASSFLEQLSENLTRFGKGVESGAITLVIPQSHPLAFQKQSVFTRGVRRGDGGDGAKARRQRAQRDGSSDSESFTDLEGDDDDDEEACEACVNGSWGGSEEGEGADAEERHKRTNSNSNHREGGRHARHQHHNSAHHNQHHAAAVTMQAIMDILRLANHVSRWKRIASVNMSNRAPYVRCETNPWALGKELSK